MAKVIIWGMMSFRDLSDLHIVSRVKTAASVFYVEEVRNGVIGDDERRTDL